MATTQQQQLSPAQINAAARSAIKARAQKMTVQLSSQTFVPSSTQTLNIQPRNVGLLIGFMLKVVHSVSNGSAVQIDRTDFGGANALPLIQFSDLQNYQRHYSTGYHFAFVNSVKARRPFGYSIDSSAWDGGTNFATKYGTNWTVNSCPATIAAAGNGTVTQWYWVPIMYSEDDMRGAIYANVTGATMALILNMPAQANICVDNGSDSTNSMFVGDAAGSTAAVSITSTTVTTYQVFYDQLPTFNGQVLLPILDMATIYELKNSTLKGMTANQLFGYQYANLRDILSTFLVYNNSGTTGRVTGADINYFSLQAANATEIWHKEPNLIAMETRNFMGTDFPPGVYYFGSRQRNISTQQYGNMQLMINPITAGAAAYETVLIEDFAVVQQLSNAGSLPTA